MMPRLVVACTTNYTAALPSRDSPASYGLDPHELRHRHATLSPVRP